MDLPTAANLAVAAGTLGLAGFTASMAAATRRQAEATRQMVALAERTLAATAAPVMSIDHDHGGLRPMRDGICLWVRNDGAVAATITAAFLTLAGRDAVNGKLVSGAVLEPGSTAMITFPDPGGDRGRASVDVRFTAPGSGPDELVDTDIPWREATGPGAGGCWRR